MSVQAKIGILVICVCVVYTWVGHLVPQKEEHPPGKVSADSSPAELAELGKSIFGAACGQCHGVPGAGGTDRAPDIDGVATRAPDRAAERAEALGEPFTANDYLAESLLNPGAYLVEREPGVTYGNIMSFRLSALETLAVLAFVQSLGGDPTVTAGGPLWEKWGKDLEAAAASGGGPKALGPPEQIIKTYKCVDCHDFEGNTIPNGGGPPLSDVGSRMSAGDILVQILDPDSQIAKPVGEIKFEKGVMKAGLAPFYADVGGEDLVKLAAWLSKKRSGTPPPPPAPGFGAQ